MTSTPPTASDQRATVVAGFLGWTLDGFDFFLVVMTLAAIAKEFGKSDAAIALSITLTLAFRPVGAFIFGLLADRYGRKLPLMIDLVFYSLVEVLTGLAPNYTTFLVLRALFGIGMGAEWGVGASLVMEKVPARYRGVVSGLLQRGFPRPPGHVSHLPRAGRGLQADDPRRAHRVLSGRGADRWCVVRAVLRPVGAAPHHRARAGRRGPDRPSLGIRTDAAPALGRRVHHAVLRPGRMGRDPRALERALARSGARVPARFRLPVRRGDREPDPARASTVRHAHELRTGHGALRGHRLYPRRRGRWARTRAPGSGVRARLSLPLGTNDDVRQSHPGVSAGPAHPARTLLQRTRDLGRRAGAHLRATLDLRRPRRRARAAGGLRGPSRGRRERHGRAGSGRRGARLL